MAADVRSPLVHALISEGGAECLGAYLLLVLIVAENKSPRGRLAFGDGEDMTHERLARETGCSEAAFIRTLGVLRRLGVVVDREPGAVERRDCRPASDITAWCLRIYDAYPRKVGKQAALAKIRNALLSGRIDPPALLSAVEAYAKFVSEWPEDRRQFIPHPTTWFNQGRWEDDRYFWDKGMTTQAKTAPPDADAPPADVGDLTDAQRAELFGQARKDGA